MLRTHYRSAIPKYPGGIDRSRNGINIGRTVAKVVPVEGEAISPLVSVVVIKPVVVLISDYPAIISATYRVYGGIGGRGGG